MIEQYKRYLKKQALQNFPVVKFKTNFTNCILEAMKRRGYRQTDGDDWDLCWSEKDGIADLYETKRLLLHQKINHFRNYFEIARKDMLLRNLKKHRKALERQNRVEQSQQYNFFPVSYMLPSQYVIFVDEFKRQQNDKAVWIMKPTARSQGKGIFLFNKLSSVSAWESHNSQNYIVQRYIADPLLIGGKKFDMRIYVLVTSFSPLTIYLYRSGFARFTHYRYEDGKLNQTEIHLTNVAIQKQTDNYDEHLGGKWMLGKMRPYLLSKYGAEKVNTCFNQIQELIIKTLEAVQKIMNTDRNHSFQLYGFDVLLDSQFQPWLLEVNGSPSMTANTPMDQQLKIGLLDDTLSVVDMEHILTEKEEQIGGFDLIYKGGNVWQPPGRNSVSFLGTSNNRMTSIRKLAKAAANRTNQQPTEIDKRPTMTSTTTNISNQNSRRQPRKVLNQTGNNSTGAAGVGQAKRDFVIKPKVAARRQPQNHSQH